MIKRAWLLEEHIMEKPQILLFDFDGALLRNDKIKQIQKSRAKAGETAYIRILRTLGVKL